MRRTPATWPAMRLMRTSTCRRMSAFIAPPSIQSDHIPGGGICKRDIPPQRGARSALDRRSPPGAGPLRTDHVERVHGMAEIERLEAREAGVLDHALQQAGVEAERAEARAARLRKRRRH